MALIEPQNLSNPLKFEHFFGENYDLAVNKLIQSLFDSIDKANSDVFGFSASFQELVQVKVNPPVKPIWFYCGLTFRKPNVQKDEIFDQVLYVKDLFGSICCCSGSCSCLKSVALIAPVVYELCRVVGGLKGDGVGLKRGKKVMREIRALVDVILGYVNVCFCGGANEADDDYELIRPLGDLVRIWVGDIGTDYEGVKEGLRVFFPLLSDEIVEGMSVEGCEVGELAGVVAAEVFLLKMCLEFRDGVMRDELVNELRTWAVGSITAFRNLCFFETLVKMLLEPTLPVSSLLSSEDEMLLRKVLYDAVILPEYTFLNPERIAHQPAKKSLGFARLIVIHKATEFNRRNGEHTKAISYINAFSNSHLPAELLKWVASEIGIEEKANGPSGSSPTAMLKWLFSLEDQGKILLNDEMSKYRATLASDGLNTDNEQLELTANRKKSESDLIFFIDNKGNEDDQNEETDNTNEPMSDAFVAAAHAMRENGGRRKRKDGRGSEEKQVKFLKYNISGQSGSTGKDGSSSEGEVENPHSDDDEVEV